MIHFAYPNVKPRDSKFLGCGRYAASSLGEKPGPDYKLVKLSIPNKSEVNLAALKLAPEISDSKRVIYEKKDESTERYRGESLDLAYMLTLISRCRRIRSRMGEKMKGDIWCTGRIDIKNNEFPFLKAVNFSGFELKLKAFLSDKNKDRLFIAPESNIDPSLQGMFMQEDVEVLSMKRFLELDVQDDLKRKIILKVPENELEHLVDLIFEKVTMAAIDEPDPGIGPGKPRGKWMVGFAMLLFALAALWMYDAFTKTSPVDKIISCLENGKFSKARELIEKASLDDHEIQKLNISIAASVKISGYFIYSYAIDGDLKEIKYALNSITPGEIRVSDDENFRLEINSNSEIEQLFIYVFSFDAHGTTEILFPNPRWNKGGNPVTFTEASLQIPSKSENEVLENEESKNEESEKKPEFHIEKRQVSEGERLPEENIIIIASPWKASDFERLFERIKNETDPNEQNKMIDELIEILRLRKKSNFESIFYKEFSFEYW